MPMTAVSIAASPPNCSYTVLMGYLLKMNVQLPLYTGYSLRLLVYPGMRTAEPVTIDERAGAYRISRKHLDKVELFPQKGLIRANIAR